MAFEARRPRLAGPVALRSLIAGCLAFAALQLLAATHFYATAAALAGLALLAVWDAARFERTTAARPAAADQPGRRHLQQGERSAALLDAVTVALLAVAEDGRILFANLAARRLAGAVPGRLADLPLLAPAAADEILALPAGARRILTLADGRPALVWTVALAAPGEPPQKLVSLQLVAGELDAVQLRAWQDMSRVLAHEIMNSLTPIASLSESLAARAASGDDGELNGALAIVARRSRHLLDFVERYRVLADLPEPRLRPIRAADLAAEAAAALAVPVDIAIDPPDLVFQGDPELLAQALINLLRNAAEAAPADDPRIALACARGGSAIVWSVADNGPGIPADRLQEMFLPFFTTKKTGTGIGLTLARHVALAHGGRLEAADAPAGGALFTLTLPA